MKDFIYTITVDIVGEGEGEYVTENNYKEIIRDLEGSISSIEYDNELLDENLDNLADGFEAHGETMSWNEWNEKANKITNEMLGNREFIKRCENTIKIIEMIAELREWE